MNRKAIIERHLPVLNACDPLSPFSVGNGEFAFTADITGLQTFPAAYENGMPLHTQSQWGWHSFANPNNYKIEDTLEDYDVAGRKVPYASGAAGNEGYSAAANWLRANPHRLDLGRLGLILRSASGEAATPNALSSIKQTLNLWVGHLESRFTFEGAPLRVTTVCDPQLDLIGVRIKTPQRRVGVRLAFPYGSGDWKRAADWTQPQAHQTTLRLAPQRADFIRTLDKDGYHACLAWTGAAKLSTIGAHEFELWSLNGTLEFVLAFAPTTLPDRLPNFENTAHDAAKHWAAFWSNGGALDLSQSRDPRWRELERRVVLSQYQTAINCAGSAPPQETGLVCNSWHGKFHLEMHWWHATHFALWNRLPLLEKSLHWYASILPEAQKTARRQGYSGARWPKMTACAGHDSPSNVGVFLIWQQPHPIYFAELCYRTKPDAATLARYSDIVFETAEFMASYPVWDDAGRFLLGPALIPAQESYGAQRRTNLNPTFELAYWHWALGIAQQWRERRGLARIEKWDYVRDHLARPPIQDGLYSAIETPPYLVRRDHPSMLGALGFLPTTPLIDGTIMRNTLQSVLASWDWKSTWGWDYPLMALTAVRVGRPDLAIEALFLDTPKNVYLPNGHNYQDARLPLYLPGNGGLLTAIAMMARGWDNGPPTSAPGFPQGGSWTVHQEGLLPML